jgi:hypothetical protein
LALEIALKLNNKTIVVINLYQDMSYFNTDIS